jgi:phosphoribosylanthranilate isomerase
LKVKICGLTNFEDAMVAYECGAWALGFIFYNKSPRYIAPKQAREIIQMLPNDSNCVGVFVNEELEVIKNIQSETGIKIIQLHGDETPDFCKQFEEVILKSVNLGTDSDVNQALSYPKSSLLLTESKDVGEKRGGTGLQSDWSLASKLSDKRKILLSGGINSANIKKGLKAVKPFALDICSGVELKPGKKDHNKIIDIFKIINECEDEI